MYRRRIDVQMARRGNGSRSVSKGGDSATIELDELDLQILDMILMGASPKDIASQTNRPLSTVQRRIRKLFEADAVRSNVELNYRKLGLKSGEIFIYLKDGDVKRIAEQLAAMEGMRSVSIHIGNSDIIGIFMYKDSAHLLELTSKVRQIPGVDRIVWSEEIYKLPVRNEKSLAPVMKWIPKQ